MRHPKLCVQPKPMCLLPLYFRKQLPCLLVYNVAWFLKAFCITTIIFGHAQLPNVFHKSKEVPSVLRQHRQNISPSQAVPQQQKNKNKTFFFFFTAFQPHVLIDRTTEPTRHQLVLKKKKTIIEGCLVPTLTRFSAITQQFEI